MTPIRRGLLAASLSLTLWGAAWADTPPVPSGVVSLSSTASAEVTQDLLTVAFSVTREGQDTASVQAQLKQALDAALAEARRVAKPGQIEVQTGNFSLFPRYNKTGQISGWQGSTELVVEGRDMQGIGALTGRITTMSIARVGQGLSRELREKTEGDVAAQAIARYRAKAADYAKQFGYSGYVLREVNVSAADQGVVPEPRFRAQAMAMKSDEALPVEAGKGAVSITVNGTVQLTR